MDRIKLLPEIVANQIAAGEVVNSPSHVVKEMMENSLDAGAKCVRVNFRNGGKELIQIIDDGVGMSPIDARMSFDRHATSKIRTIDDVYSLHTFGFRGEALASIAAVAEVELRTRQEGDEIGTLTTISGGQFQNQTPISCPKGTQFMVRNIFYNVPSRRKFIDGDNARLSSQIKQEFSRVALCNHDVSFELRQNDQPVYMLQPTNRRGRIVDLIGKHIKNNLLDVSVDTSVVRIEGFVGTPAAAKRRNNEQYLFVNGRYFHSTTMQRTILRAYEKLIPEGCMPSFFIYLSVDPDRVDVNVHPQKTTVKFADNDVILEILQAAIRETLAKTGAVPMMDFSNESRVEIPVIGHGHAIYNEPRSATNSSYNPFAEEYIDHTAPIPDVPFTGFDVPYDGSMPRIKSAPKSSTTPSSFGNGYDEEYTIHSSSELNESRIEYSDIASEEQASFDYYESGIGGEARTFGDTIVTPTGYAIATYGGSLVVVSLRRARERLLYEDMLRAMTHSAAPTQRMFFAEELTLSLEEYELMEQHATEFAAMGFEVEYRGEGHIAVTGRPAMLDVAIPLDELIYELLHGIDNGAMPVDEERARLAELLARRASAGYGKNLRRADAEELLKRLEQCDNPSFAPSGAPIMAELTTDELRAKLTRN
ncbi:MAG: DNA mismatch repair endonuclease MutL [Rikenellaceae bacterium]|nr:DNA mismatch repair endonuclease MutL [Rikenellaceae bacterium]